MKKDMESNNSMKNSAEHSRLEDDSMVVVEPPGDLVPFFPVGDNHPSTSSMAQSQASEVGKADEPLSGELEGNFVSEETVSLSGFSGSTVVDEDENSRSSIQEICEDEDMDILYQEESNNYDVLASNVEEENEKSDRVDKTKGLRNREQIIPEKENNPLPTGQLNEMNGSGEAAEDDEIAVIASSVMSPSTNAPQPPTSIMSPRDEEEENLEADNNDDEAELDDWDGKPTIKKSICHSDHIMVTRLRKVICLDCKVAVCPICFYNVGSTVPFHLRSADCNSYRCSICMVYLKSECALKAHQRLHDNHQPIEPYVCAHCGVKYVQKSFFLAHSLGKCVHLNFAPMFECDLCQCVDDDGLICGLQMFREHQTSQHMLPAFRCSLCNALLVTSKVDALLHAKENHNVSCNSWSLAQCGLKRTHYCEYCDEEVNPHHMAEEHSPENVHSYVYSCGCTKSLKTEKAFRIHRRSCYFARTKLPAHWKSLLEMEVPSEKKDDDQEDSDSSLKERCRSTYRPKKKPRPKKCVHCAADLTDEEAAEKNCKECQEFQRDAAFTNYTGQEQIVGGEEDTFKTCEILYDPHLHEHNYGKREDFTTIIVPELREQCKLFKVPFFEADIENNFENDVAIHNTTSKDGQDVTCCVCNVAIHDGCNNMIDSTIEHFKLFHYDAVVPLRVPSWLKKPSLSEAVDKDAPSTDKKQVIKMTVQDECLLSIADRLLKQSSVVKKTFRISPDSPKTSNKVVSLNDKDGSSKEPANTSNSKTSARPLQNKSMNGNLRASKRLDPQNDAEIAPSEKEHEFWDKINEALTTAENKKPSGETDSDVLQSYSSRRVSKRPKRYASESDESNDEHSTPPKEKTESTPPKSNPTVPEELRAKKANRTSRADSTEKSNSSEKRTLRVESTEKSISSEGEPLSAAETTEALVLNSKRKRNRGDYYDPDIERLKASLESDKEMGFIAKTFDSSSAVSGKRRLKPSSKLRYNQLLTAQPGPQSAQSAQPDLPYEKQTCCICYVKYETREEFLDHIRTHRTDDNTFQCMECGECFVIRATLEKHLHFFHKIKQPDVYIRENAARERVQTTALQVHQCSVCMEVCRSGRDLSKHFRMHGTAYLNKVKKANT